MKEWQTSEEPRLLVIGDYQMSLMTTLGGDGTNLDVTIDYIGRRQSSLKRLPPWLGAFMQDDAHAIWLPMLSLEPSHL